MSTLELKKKLINQINKTSDPSTIKDLLRLLEIEAEGEDIIILNDEQKKSLIEAQNQIKSGDFFTNEDVIKEVDNWLSK